MDRQKTLWKKILKGEPLSKKDKQIILITGRATGKSAFNIGEGDLRLLRKKKHT